jgi:hypothetical protein
MQINTSKIASFFVIALMMLSMTIISMPANAQNIDEPHGGAASGYVGPTTIPTDAPSTTLQVDTNPYLSVTPNPTGIGQYVLVNFWITPPPSANRFLAGFTVAITKPDGTKDTIGPLNSYRADGTSWSQYIVDQAGTWQFQFNFAGEYFPTGYYLNDLLMTNTSGSLYPAMYYKPATSNIINLTVLNQQVLSYPPSKLPTDYWTRPISPQNREWFEIAGPYPWPFMNWVRDWMGPFITAPNSAHIAWYKVNSLNGIIGGDTGQVSVTTAPGYPSVIYDGRAYQSINKPGVGTVAGCYDIRTGQVYYEIPDGVVPAIVAFYPPGFSAATQAATVGTYELLAGSITNFGQRSVDTRLIKINPLTGLVTTNVTGMAGWFYNGQYVLSIQDLGAAAGSNRYRMINWTTSGTSDVFATRVLSNVSTPLATLSFNLIDWDNGIGVQVNRFGQGQIYGGNPVAYSLITGQVIWNITTGVETPFGGGGQGAATMDYGKVAICMENGFWDCFDEFTGKLLWKSEQTQLPWGEFWSYSAASWNNLLFTDSYVGVIAFDWNTGKIVWQTPANAAPYETPYNGEQAFHSASIVADGKMYTYSDEHTATQPLTRGWKYYCLNATTGQVIWSIQGWNSDSRNFGGSVADGYLATSDQYSGTTWVFGKGKSATTIAAPDVSIPLGTSFVIRGTVIDMSPAQPNTPCVSADSMSTQMEYLHMGMPINGVWNNETITGVPVTLTALDSNGNSQNIGTIITDGYYGTFTNTWTPPIQGDYKIIASFAGDDSYSSSSASTSMTVGLPSSPSVTPQVLQSIPDYTMTFIAGVIAIIIALAIATLVILRKK